MKKLRLVFADDHPLVLAGIRDFFANDIRFDITACVTTPTELIEHIIKEKPDVAITDLSMPGDTRHNDGLALIAYLANHFPQTQILVVTMMSNPLVIASLYKAGASGVVLKSDPPDTLKIALEALRLGRQYLHPSLMRQQPSADTTLASDLSRKEIEVLRRFIGGQSLKDIAYDLSRSIKTISNQKRSAMRKLNVSNDQELITFCTRHRLLD
ncbi:response regulator transcription factor [Corticimicrobacter populi]|uniref:DNA-binding response regulator n=1 Tax=Corticimicrobacter populi TaxID=2175229 RepID=A0A2V1JVC2_9BURK|nr:response regulator transcription factor [Corticimicrobacter populi]PWF22150.1 DNA-binding response regulator [Corticimicrobacter populi]